MAMDSRSRIDWTLDLSILRDVDIELQRPPAKDERREVAAETLEGARGDRMLEQAALPVAGWYSDPSAAFAHRWWDGAQWTHVVAVHGKAFIAEPGRALRPAPVR